jgi:NADPH:quinone reductase-like Zn-dependent oxidoreductase
MKAAFLENVNEPLVIKEIPTPEPGENEVLIKLEYSSLNHRDVFIQKGRYPAQKTGLILGSDGYGTVSAAGRNADVSLVGKGVVINASHNWGNKPEAFGPDFKILGSPDHGTFAEYIVVNHQYVHLKPAHLTGPEAGALPLAGLTTYRAVFTRAKIRKGEKVLVTGIGAGTALLALQYALAAGAEVYVTSGSGEKIEKAIALGASGGTNYKTEDWAKRLQEQYGGFDVILDSASGKGFAQLLEVTNPGGRVVFWGGTDGPINNIIPRNIYWKNISILGTTMGTMDEFKQMLAFSEANHIRPVVDKIFPSLDHVQEAIDYMDKGNQFGKIVLRNV